MTPAIHALDEANIQYQLLEYSHERSNDGFGNEAVEKLGLSDDVVFKTLLVQLSSQEIIVCLVPVGLSLSFFGREFLFTSGIFEVLKPLLAR